MKLEPIILLLQELYMGDRNLHEADPSLDARIRVLVQLSWELLRSPAPPEWPREFWMLEQPELRNYLFPGFFETWPEPANRSLYNTWAEKLSKWASD